MTRWLVRAAGLLLVVLSVAGLWVRATDHDPEIWHADPTTAARTGQPNDFLAAPLNSTQAPIDLALSTAPEEPLAAFDRVAMAAPRTEIVAGSVGDGHITYVQRSALFGFPDYVSVKRVVGPEGATIAAWSRSRFGHSDLGVNEQRLAAWLAAGGFE
ncbi:MAG: DUF1499 domain-containing protein [Pseudomonadota bacterium]